MLVNKDRYVFKCVANPCLESKILADVRDEKDNKVIAEAIFQKCDDANANGHSFPKRVLTEAINKVQNEVKDRHLVGELDHPDNIDDVNRIANVLLKDVSH